MVLTNKLNIEINYKNFVANYTIVKFTTSEKYIPNGANFLDELPTKIKVKSIVFSGEFGEKNLYALFVKSEIEKINLRKELNSIKKGEILTFDKSTNEVDFKKIPNYILAQLLINSLSTPMINRYRFNNLSGYFFYFNTNNYETKKTDDTDIVVKIKALQIKINSNQEFEFNVKTFSSLYLKNKLGFTKKRPLSKYPKYTFSYSTNTLRRILTDENVESLKIFVIKQEPNKKSTIPFINFSNLNEYNASKIGALSFLISKINENLNQLISISFNRLENLSFTKYEDTIKKEKEHNIREICLKNRLNIIDELKDDYSQVFIDNLISHFKTYFDNKIKLTNKIMKNQFNLRIIHNKKYYEKYKIADIHQTSKESILHNITFEDFKPKKASIDNIVKEIIIKKDIIAHQISILNWKKYNYRNKWIFGIKNEDKFYFLTILPNGELKFDIFEPNLFNQQEFDTYCDIFETNSNIEGIVINSNLEINAIEKTSLFTIPDYKTISKTLILEHTQHDFTKKELNDYINQTEIEESRRLNYFNIFNKKIENTFSKDEILRIITHRTDRKNLSIKIHEKTGILIRAYLKGQDRYDILASNLDIVTQTTKNGMIYFVGTKGKGIQSQIPRASIIRKIIPINGHPVFFKQLIELMNVDFVKNGDLTVKPFPFKYLEEWIEMNKK